jgi:hypothetical protein
MPWILFQVFYFLNAIGDKNKKAICFSRKLLRIVLL